MNENDKGGGNRRRSSRRRGGRSGGRQQDRSNAAQRQPQAVSRQGDGRGAEAERPRQEKSRRGERRSSPAEQQNRRGSSERSAQNVLEKAKGRASYPDRPRWTPPRSAPPVLPKPDCPRCGRPIEDLAAAINDRESGLPVHFDCVVERIAEGEPLGEGDKIIYIGGGRFGVVHFDNPNDLKRFQIKKTLQWEEKEKRSQWRKEVADQYSAT